jgi:predicted sugar kinase
LSWSLAARITGGAYSGFSGTRLTARGVILLMRLILGLINWDTEHAERVITKQQGGIVGGIENIMQPKDVNTTMQTLNAIGL